MKDIVDRLRDTSAPQDWLRPWCAEAADEIKRLRAAEERLTRMEKALDRLCEAIKRRSTDPSFNTYIELIRQYAAGRL